MIALDAPETLADLHERLGFVPLDRIRMDPPPGTATEADVIRHLDGGNKRLYELIDGTLVEKAVGTLESILAAALITRLSNYADTHDLGLVSGADGPFRMLLGNVRYPDVSFIPWSAFPDREIPDDAIWSIVPALAIEVLSDSNTVKEITRKIGEFFSVGIQCVWVIDPPSRTAGIYRTATEFETVDTTGTLDGGSVLPGFRLPLADIFAKLNRFKKRI